ncbi:MAG: type II toxin-antitoxin system RelE/ParE family toxin [Planctomycetes bacterium]|nr:type II toxin-antitoxin system RelE/ParE family toxin [Planctomycetota bacterium]
MRDHAAWWAEHRSAEQAARWLTGFEEALESLQQKASRCGLARENDSFPFELRQLHYGLSRRPTHRAVFEIRGDEVVIHAIRHLAQADITPEDI